MKAIAFAALVVAGCSHEDPIVHDWREELDRPVTRADYRLKLGYCTAIASSNRQGVEPLRRKCGAIAYDVIDMVKPQFPSAPLPELPKTDADTDGRYACQVTCGALAFADRDAPRWRQAFSDAAQRCTNVGDCDAVRKAFNQSGETGAHR